MIGWFSVIQRGQQTLLSKKKKGGQQTRTLICM